MESELVVNDSWHSPMAKLRGNSYESFRFHDRLPIFQLSKLKLPMEDSLSFPSTAFTCDLTAN